MKVKDKLALFLSILTLGFLVSLYEGNLLGALGFGSTLAMAVATLLTINELNLSETPVETKAE